MRTMWILPMGVLGRQMLVVFVSSVAGIVVTVWVVWTATSKLTMGVSL